MSHFQSISELIERRHPEWVEHQQRWQWLLDSLEGGERYRNAVYGYDTRGMPIRNLVRHKREYPDPRELGHQPGGLDANPNIYCTTDDDYELRRARTPIPTFLAEAVDTHLSRVYAREVRRVGPAGLTAWWTDVDGCGATIDQWMSETIAPLLLCLGQLDICIDHPYADEGGTIETRADLEDLGLSRCNASYILPQNMLWWKLDERCQRYLECLVREYHDSPEGCVARYRYWNEVGSTLFDESGEIIREVPHPYGRVPIIRVFDRRKPRCSNIGQSRYEGIAERQREYYNRDSELILSDTTQAHPLLQGPEEYVQADGSIPIGPGWLLPKKRNTTGGNGSYEGFEVVVFPKEGAESIRRNKEAIREEVDRDLALVKPAGGGGGIQSGLAKAMDHVDGNNRLAKLAKMLARTEHIIAELAMIILNDGDGYLTKSQEIEIVYPTEFDLFTAGDMAKATQEFQALAVNAGALPHTESLLLCRLIRLCLPGLSDSQYARCDEEINSLVQGNSSRRPTEKEQSQIP